MRLWLCPGSVWRLDKNHKFVPADAADNIVIPELPAQGLGKISDNFIPKSVAELIVHLFKIVDVQYKEGVETAAVLPPHLPDSPLGGCFGEQTGHFIGLDQFLNFTPSLFSASIFWR